MSAAEAAKVNRNEVPFAPNFEPKKNPTTEKMVDPLGFISHTAVGEKLRSGQFNWLTIIGLLGIMIAFGHSILAMSGEETLAQVYREVEAPKLPNFRKAAFIVFIYSMGLTSAISFLAVLLIPDQVRMSVYADNLIGGLSMFVIGPVWAKLLLNAFVVVIGGLILSGAVNTAIIGSNGVLNRVAEDGVLPTWLRKPHPKYGTTYRVLYLILALKLTTIIASQGDVLLLGEAYAFGVVWSFVFMTASMVILRYKDKSPREFRMPLNLKLGSIEIPLGLVGVFLILLGAAISNLLTKDVATISGLIFTAAFLVVFSISERFARRKREMHPGGDKHLEQFTIEAKEDATLTREGLRLPPKPYLKLIAIRSPQNLFMLEKSLAETDPETTNVVVMTAKVLPQGDTTVDPQLDLYEQQLMTAVVDRAEKAGKHVTPLIVPTNNPLNAVLSTAHDLKARDRDGRLQQVRHRYATGGGAVQLAGGQRRQRAAGFGADLGSRPRRVPEHGRGQPHPENQRAAGTQRGRTAGGGGGGASGIVASRRHGARKRSVPAGADDAGRAGDARLCDCRGDYADAAAGPDASGAVGSRDWDAVVDRRRRFVAGEFGAGAGIRFADCGVSGPACGGGRVAAEAH